MYICGCIALSDGQNRDVIWIISVFGVIAVIFGQNVGILPPGSPHVGFLPTGMAFI